MNEQFISYLWKYKLLDSDLATADGEPLQVINPGVQNSDSGPDFFNARVKIGNTVWAGNVEIHVKSSDWFQHGHQNDNAYDSVVLSVVYEHDKEIKRKNGEIIPTLEIKNKFAPSLLEKYDDYQKSMRKIPCSNDLDKADYLTILSWLERLTIERLQEKADVIRNEIENRKFDFQEVFYHKLARYFGFRANNDAFEQLARSVPLSVAARHNENLLQLEALCFGQAGLLSGHFHDQYPKALQEEYRFLRSKYNLKPMDKSVWRFMRMRPANFPTLRISQFARLIYRSSGLLQKIITEENLDNLRTLFHVKASEYWENHYRFDSPTPVKKGKTIGKSSIDVLLINTIIPFVFAYGTIHDKQDMKDKAIAWLGQIEAENNTFTRLFDEFGVTAENAMHSQALIQLKTRYCDEKRCLECAIGHYLLKSQAE